MKSTVSNLPEMGEAIKDTLHILDRFPSKVYSETVEL